MSRIQASDEVARLLAVIETQNELASAALALDEVMAVVAARAADLTGADAGVVELPDREEMVYRATTPNVRHQVGLRLRIDQSLSGRCLLEGHTLRCDDAATDPRVDREACERVGASSMLCVPLDDGESTRGVLKVCSSRPGAFGEADEAILGQLSGVVVAHMRRAIEYERKEYESRHDLLTGLGNRRAYEERLAKEVARAQRYGTPLTLLLLDLDGFKAVNDAHGHPAGDEVLRRVSQAFDRLRRADDCYRIGGDEFAIVLPQTGEPGGRAAAERVGDEVARRTAAHGVTATFGLAVYAEGDWSDLHALADARLMTAKRRR